MSMGAGPGRGRIYYVGIFCDSCGRQEVGDVAASSQGAAEDGLRVDLATVKGWVCDAAGDFCPRCGLAAAVAVTESVAGPAPGDATPAPRRTGPPEVEALHAIDQLIGNAETISAEALGKVRGIVLDALNGWHERQRTAESEPGGGLWA